MNKPSFENEANRKQRGLLKEFFDYARSNKKWWLTPILAVVILLAGLVILGASGAAPFIYTLF